MDERLARDVVKCIHHIMELEKYSICEKANVLYIAKLYVHIEQNFVHNNFNFSILINIYTIFIVARCIL